MQFLDRESEVSRLNRCLVGGELAVVVGRRRIGKTRLILEWLGETAGLYYVADRSSPAVQRRYFAQTAARRFPGFGDVAYPDWRSVLDRLAREGERDNWHGPLVIDEIPYLAESDASIAPVLQNWVDEQRRKGGITLVVAGSSRRMMHGLVLDASAPLYGRANQMLDVGPLPAGIIGNALGISDATAAVRAYALWGGVPRYWELAEPFGQDSDGALDDLVLDPLSPLHTEIDRLLLDEIPPAVSLRPILDAVGGGANRLSVIAARIGKPATSLSRPIQQLIEAGMIRRNTPFGEPSRSSKRSLYTLADPFARVWFRLVAPHKSFLADANRESRTSLWERHRDTIFAEAWEDLCRMSVSRLGGHAQAPLGNTVWQPAGRHWRGNDPEFDVVSVSDDRSGVLLGEVKWSESPRDLAFAHRTFRSLAAKGAPPKLRGTTPEYAIFVPRVTASRDEIATLPFHLVTAKDVMKALTP